MLYKMAGNSFRFRAMVGLDDRYSGGGSGRFHVMEEDAFGGKVLFDSGLMTIELSEKVEKEFKFTQGLWEGALAELLIFDAKLSDQEREKLEGSLIGKWLEIGEDQIHSFSY